MIGDLSRRFTGNDASATDNVILVQLGPEVCRCYKRFEIQATAGAADVEVSLDNSTFAGPTPIRSTSGVALASDEVNVSGVATKVGYIEGPLDGLIVRKKGTVNPTTVIVTAVDPVGA